MESKEYREKKENTDFRNEDFCRGRVPGHAVSCEAPIQTPSDIAERYTLNEFLGRGSQGSVYAAVRNSDGLPVAIKVLQINAIQNWKEYELFWREAKALQSLSVPGVATFYEAIENLDDDQPHAYLVQQLICGKTLADSIRSGVRFSIQHVFSLAIQMIDILEKLHHHDPPMIHRDIKPSNILLEPDGKDYKVYLTDFGAVYNPLVQKGGSTVAGTFGYMPPEQLTGNVSPASDIYALGVMLAELLSGISPTDMEVTEFRLNIEKPLESVPSPVVSLIRRMTMPQEQDRLCDYTYIRQRFSAFARNQFIEDANLAEIPQITPKEYSHQLKKVQRIGQKGNLDLWLQLPEQTPREIPAAYRKLKQCDKKRVFDILQNVYRKATFLLNPLNILLNFKSYFVCIKDILIGVWLCFFYSFVYIMPPFFVLICIYGMITSSKGVGEIIGLSFGALSFLVLFGAEIVLKETPVQRIIRILQEHYTNRKITLTNSDNMKNLLKNGRKSLATVQSVRYQENSENPYPEFILQYAFNPPDDSEPGDLMHEVVVLYDPDLKRGDALPILYTVSEDGKDVMSMPYPLSTQALPELSSCYCKTQKGVIQCNTGKKHDVKGAIDMMNGYMAEGMED